MSKKVPIHCKGSEEMNNQKENLQTKDSTNVVSNIATSVAESRTNILKRLLEQLSESSSKQPLALDPDAENKQHIFNVSLVKTELETEPDESFYCIVQEDESTTNSSFEQIYVKQELEYDNEDDLHFPNTKQELKDEGVEEYFVYNTHEDVELTIDTVKVEMEGVEMNDESTCKINETENESNGGKFVKVKIPVNGHDIDGVDMVLGNEDETQRNVEGVANTLSTTAVSNTSEPPHKKRKTEEEGIAINAGSSSKGNEVKDEPNEDKMLKVKAPCRTYQRTMARKRQIPSWGTKETEQTVNVDQENVAVIDKSMEDTRVANESSNLSIQLNFKTKCKTFSLRSSKVFNLNQFHNCLFCKQKFTYIFRHFVKKHRSQLDVSCALPMDKRLKQFIRLKRLGDFINNVYYLKSKEGKLIVLTQSERFLGKCEPEKFVPCPDCTGFIHESQLFSHYFKCIAKQPRHVPVTKRKLLKESRLLLRHTLLTSAFSINKLLPFRVGLNKFIKAAKNDECLSLFGKHMVEIKSQSDDKYLAVRSMMQRLGCILVSCRRLSHNPHLTMSELLVPDNINLLIRSIRSLLLSKTESLQKLELSTDLFSKINACVFFLRSNCLMEGKLNKADQYLRFYYIFLETWEKQIGDLGVNKMTDLPLVTNLINLKKNLELTIIKLIDKIKVSKYNINSIWCDLAESTLSLICLFNAVEFNIIELLKIKEYAVRPDWSVDELEEYKDKLPNFTYYLAAKRFLVSTNFYGKEYYILFTKVIKKAIDVLISSRYRTSISPNNGFVFANLNYSLTSFKSVNCFLNLCVKTGYLKADQLRDVKSRKYLSFLTQIIDMSPEEATWAIKYIPIDDRKSRKKLNFELESELYRALDIWRIHLKEETNSSPKQQDGSSSNK